MSRCVHMGLQDSCCWLLSCLSAWVLTAHEHTQPLAARAGAWQGFRFVGTLDSAASLAVVEQRCSGTCQ
jgi:hypothetical protein